MSNTASSICVLDSFKQLEAHITAALISKIAPTDYHRNNASLWNLARLVKGYEHSIGRAATAQERLSVFDHWCVVARRFWRTDLTRDDYYAQFLEACSYACIGLDENPVDVAVSRAKAAPLPEVEGFTDERIRLIVAICREMQVLTKDSPFFLPTRKLGQVLGVHWTRVAHWLRGLEFQGIIHLAPGEVRKQGGNRSPRYHYGKRLRATEAIAVTLTSSEAALLTHGHPSNNAEGAKHGDFKQIKPVTRRGVVDVDTLTLSRT
jgi:hypothetical protein